MLPSSSNFMHASFIHILPGIEREQKNFRYWQAFRYSVPQFFWTWLNLLSPSLWCHCQLAFLLHYLLFDILKLLPSFKLTLVFPVISLWPTLCEITESSNMSSERIRQFFKAYLHYPQYHSRTRPSVILDFCFSLFCNCSNDHCWDWPQLKNQEPGFVCCSFRRAVSLACSAMSHQPVQLPRTRSAHLQIWELTHKPG